MDKISILIRAILKFIVKNIFKIMCLLPLNRKVLVMDSWKGQELKGNLKQLYQKLSTETDLLLVVIGKQNQKYTSNQTHTKVVKSLSLAHLYYLATAKYCVVDTLYYEFFSPRKEMKYILIWHAAGCFKRFGLDILEQKTKERKIYLDNGKKLSGLVISSPNMIEIYEHSLGVSKERILPFGLPRVDALVNDVNRKINSLEKYEIDERQKIILYAPTFRKEGLSPFELNIDVLKMKKLGQDYTIIIRIHPNQYLTDRGKEQVDMLNAKVVQDVSLEKLLIASDMLITDYSSIIFDYALLEKPIIFYTYDLYEYEKSLRGFYYEYDEFVPGPIAKNTDELIDQINNYDFNKYIKKIREFKDYYQVYDGRCTERLVEYLLQ